VGKFTEKQLILANRGGGTPDGRRLRRPHLARHAGDLQERDHRGEPRAADVTEPEEWGERRKIQEIRSSWTPRRSRPTSWPSASRT